MRDVSNKDSAGWKAVLPGQKNWTMQGEGLTVFADSYNMKYLMDLIINKTVVSLKMTTPNPSGDYIITGTGYPTSVNMSGANEANSTFSVSFQGTGALLITDPLA
jgi:predicted secreted protein